MTNKTNIYVKIEDIILAVTHTLTSCYYSLLDLDAVFPNGTDQPVDNIFQEISENKFGYILTPENLNVLASKAGDLWSMILVAYISKEDLIKKSHDKDNTAIINDAYFYMEITDGQVFEISCKDSYVDAKLKSEFENAYILTDI